ncbi:MAG: hypothetical protein HFE78_05220 [Clostridiales bacterium]|nr:hypothetical protein [Clostridiales bacterium]
MKERVAFGLGCRESRAGGSGALSEGEKQSRAGGRTRPWPSLDPPAAKRYFV